jgi:ribosomal protein S11
VCLAVLGTKIARATRPKESEYAVVVAAPAAAGRYAPMTMRPMLVMTSAMASMI